jgi:N-formylglutamate deformylase
MHDTETYTLSRGSGPLVISLPHVGTRLPADQHGRYVERAFEFEDTDWHLEPLYAFAKALGATLLAARCSRYLIDLNRPADNQPMYPGAHNTELCPTRFFTGDALYREGAAPDAAEVQRRLSAYWQPYHAALAAELERVRAAQGHVVLLDGHSIRSELPWLFEGTLPHLNLGSAGGRSCAPGLSAQVMAVFAADGQFSHVLDGRFKGGYITRHYGAPEAGVHALQLEMSWRTYMDEAPPWPWVPSRAAAAQRLLRAMVEALVDWRPC